MQFESIGGMALSGLLLLGGPLAAAETPEKAATPKEATPDPGAIVQRMCDFLKSQERFSFRADITDDQVYTEGKKLQYGMTTETFVQRPDRLRVNAQGDLVDKQFFLDGKTLTLYDPSDKVYATVEVPGDIEGALAHADQKLHLRVALADLASPKLCEHLGKGQKHALYVGQSRIGKVEADHLAFDRDDIQIQLWVASGKEPIPVKVLVTQKGLPASPQWTAVLSDWKVGPHFKPDLFSFHAPAGVQKIKFAPPPAAVPATPAPAAPAAQPQTGAKP